MLGMMAATLARRVAKVENGRAEEEADAAPARDFLAANASPGSIK